MDRDPSQRRPPGGGQNEVLQRARRIETRVTQIAIAMGIDIENTKPSFEAGPLGGMMRVVMPSPHSSIKGLIDALPANSVGGVEVFIGSELVGTFIPQR